MNTAVISYRVRLARNLRSLPFPGVMSAEQRMELIDKLSSLMTKAGFSATVLDGNTSNTARSMVEAHLISPEFAGESAPHAVLLSHDRKISVMVCEEDHLRIQAFGDDPAVCLTEARRVEALIDEQMPLAFDERLGYLTACPTNLGTGLRVSALLHLPGLTESGAIRSIIAQAQQAGLAVRGFYGEGTQAAWGYYQVSNAVTMGLGEEELVSGLADVVRQLSSAEKNSRQAILRRDPIGLADKVWRAAGILKSARRISTHEAMEALSQLRVGISLGILPCGGDIDLLSQKIWPGHLLEANPGLADEASRDEARAALLRGSLDIGKDGVFE